MSRSRRSSASTSTMVRSPMREWRCAVATSARLEPRRVGALELEAKAGARQVGVQTAVRAWTRGAVKQHLLDADVIVEILDVPNASQRAAGRDVERRCRVRRQGDAEGIAQRACLQKTADAAAARGVGLQDIDGAGVEHP